MRLRFFVILFLATVSVNAQPVPRLQVQQSLSGVSDVVTRAGANTFLVTNNNHYSLVDQQSKIQLGSIFIDMEATSLPGLGKTILLNDSVFLISSGRQILEVNLLNKKIDTFFNGCRFPEFIINYCQVPGMEHLFLLAAKTYPVDKNGYVSFEKTGPGNQRVFDDGKKCRLILYNSREKKIIRSVPFNYAITAFTPAGPSGSVLAGSFEGELLEIDTSLQSRLLIKPFTRAVHSLLRQDQYLVAVPHIAEKFLGANGEGSLYVYDTGSKKIQQLKLPVQKPEETEPGSTGVAPSADIMRIFTVPGQASTILVNYGFSRLLQVNIKNLDTLALPVKAAAASFFCYNRDSSLLIAARQEKPGIFELQGDLLYYDPARKKFLPSFNKPQQQLTYKAIYKLYDREGNYHFVGHIFHYGTMDSLVIYSSNRTAPAFISVPYGDILVNERDTTLGIQRSNVLEYGKLRLEKLEKNAYTAFEPSPVFETLLKAGWDGKSDLPYEKTRADELGNGRFLVTGFTNKGSKSIYRIVLTDTAGQTWYKTKDFETGISLDISCLSADRRFMAYYYMMNNQTVLEIIDLQKGNRVFTNSIAAGRRLHHFTFDARKPVLWYSEEIPGKKNQFYQVDCSNSTVKSMPVFSDDRFLSFLPDMEKNLLAAERYDKLMLLKLDDRSIVWEELPLTNYFRVSKSANGFLFSAEKEVHEVDAQYNHRFFASYSGFRPAEIMNQLYYKADKGVLNNFGFTYLNRGYQSGDFDAYFNRPDTVIVGAGSTNRLYNELLRKAVAKRLQYQQVKDIGMLLGNSPSVQLLNRQSIPDLVKGDELQLKFNANAAANRKLKAIHISINGIPVYGKTGRDLTGHPASIINDLTIRLLPGVNDIRLYASDEEGLISPSEHLLVNAEYNLSTPSNLYFIGIGINRFADSANNLSWSVKDIRDLAGKLQAKYPNARIDTLFDEQVTRENIIALKKKLLMSQEQDKVVIAYSGHGLLDGSFNYFLSTYPVSFSHPGEQGLPYEELENLLDQIPARQKLLLIDACHSGEVDKEEMTRINEAADSLRQQGTKGGKPTYTGKTNLGMKNSFELMQSLFVNVGKSTGATVISAAAGTQFALERGDLRNGVFTYSILEAMNKYPLIWISELRKIVGERVEQLTNGLQKPASRNETILSDWQL